MEKRNQTLDLLYSQIDLDTDLIDVRTHSGGIFFGTVKDVCRQYGIKYKELDNCMQFSAPKTRLQHFIEKLHFSRKMYAYQPY